MKNSFQEALALLPDYLGQHVLLSVSAIMLGALISLPLAIAALHIAAACAVPCWGFASVVQTIPGLALLALFYPLLLGAFHFDRPTVWIPACPATRVSCRRCWRSRSIPCCRSCATPSPL